jgi:hypothetical protein
MLLFALLGCIKHEVPAWQRAQLMTPVMQVQSDGAAQHVFAVREAQSGADGGAGAACGCE